MMKQYRRQSGGCGAPPPCKKSGQADGLARAAIVGADGYDQQIKDGSTGSWGCVSAGSYRDFPLAMVFTPNEGYGNLYSPEQALEHGTLFADLYLPFHGKFRI